MKHLSIVIGAGAVILAFGTAAMAQVPRRPEGPPVLQPVQPAPNAQPAPGAAPPAATDTPASPATPRQIPGAAAVPAPAPQPSPAAPLTPTPAPSATARQIPGGAEAPVPAPQLPSAVAAPPTAAPPVTANVEPPPQPIIRRLPGEAIAEPSLTAETPARARMGRPLRQTGSVMRNGPPADYMGSRYNREEFAPMPYGGMPMTPSSAMANPPYPWRGYPRQ